MSSPTNPTEKVPPPALKVRFSSSSCFNHSALQLSNCAVEADLFSYFLAFIFIYPIGDCGSEPDDQPWCPSVLGIHPKEPKLIYCSGKLVVVRNLDDPSDTFVYKGHNEPTTVAKFSPNGYWVASGDVSGKVRVWSYDNPEHTLKLEIPVFAGEIKDLSWDPDSKRIVAVGDGRGLMARVFMWDTGNSIGEIVGHQKRILSVDYRQTRPFRIMTASEDFNVCVFEGPPFNVGSDKLMCLYDGKSGELVDKFPAAHQASIYSVCWSPDGTQLLTSSADKTVLLWDVASRSVVTKFTFGGAKPQVKDMQVAVAWCQNHLISLSLSGDLNFLDLDNPSQPKQIVQGHQIASSGWDDQLRFANDIEYTGATALNAQPNGVAITESGLAVVSTNKGVKLLRDQKLVFETPEFSWTPTCVAISPSEDLVAIGSQEDMKIHLFDVVNGSSLVESGEITGHLGALTCVSFSPDGSLLAAGDTYREVRVWDVSSRSAKVQGMWVYHSTRVTSVAWAPSGNFIASGSLDERIYIWDVNSPMKKRFFEFSHKDGVTGVSFVSETELVSVGNDACVNYWDLSA
ncbi:hypothetical protein AM588_10004669 [Phytophthora nicotianae]|uniref:Uncharacterized protein n=1 Tax=Phytophthora nicotianae TaxID=4792 RepID=A0A0W8D150_PHYNI|nr:hypothetical protein AM588_10004669 [Phytophthora nicotianae]